MRSKNFSISNLLLVTTIAAILLTWWVTSLPDRPKERFVVHFCLTDPHEQIIAVRTRLDEPFEITLWQLTSDTDRVDNLLVGKLTRTNGQLELEVQGNLQFSGLGFRNPYVELDKPFSLPASSRPNAVVVTRPMDPTLEQQLNGNVICVPSERARTVNDIVRKYLRSEKTD